MAGKTRKGSHADDPKKLRRQLTKAEKRVSKATKKRDDAQARLDAVSVIAADLANRLAAAESSAAKTAGATSASSAKAVKARAKRSTTTTRRRRTGANSAPKDEAASSGRSGATRSP